MQKNTIATMISRLLDAIGKKNDDVKKIGDTDIYITRKEVSYTISDHNHYYTSDFINLLLYVFNKEILAIQTYPAITEDKVQDYLAEIKSSVKDYHFIPLNVAYNGKRTKNKNHWAALIIDKKQQLIFYLDPAGKKNITPQIKLLKKYLNYKKVILNSFDFQQNEKKEGYIRHCGVYLIEIFKEFRNCIQQGQKISVSILSNINKPEDVTKIRNKHIEDACAVLSINWGNLSEIQDTHFASSETLGSYPEQVSREAQAPTGKAEKRDIPDDLPPTTQTERESLLKKGSAQTSFWKIVKNCFGCGCGKSPLDKNNFIDYGTSQPTQPTLTK